MSLEETIRSSISTVGVVRVRNALNPLMPMDLWHFMNHPSRVDERSDA